MDSRIKGAAFAENDGVICRYWAQEEMAPDRSLWITAVVQRGHNTRKTLPNATG